LLHHRLAAPSPCCTIVITPAAARLSAVGVMHLHYDVTMPSGRGEIVRVIAVTNQKGGVAKTTSVINGGAALAELERRVLVVDLDPQLSATRWLAGPLDTRGLFDVLTGAEAPELVEQVVATPVAGMDLIPGSRFLTGVERAVSGQWTGPESLLRRAVDELPEDRWDVVLLDCPPTLGLVAVSALVAAREVLVPVEARVMALDGLVSLLQTLQQVREGTLNTDLGPAMILPVRVDRTRLARDVVDTLGDRLGEMLLTTRIRDSIRVAEAPSRHLAITQYASGSSGAEDYRALAAELITRVEVAA